MVVFDLDDTLHMRAAPFANAVREQYGVTDEQLIGKMFVDFRAIGVDYFHQWDAGTISEQEMYIRRTIDTFALYGYSVSEEESLAFHRTYEKYLQQIRPAEGIEGALQAAADAGIQLGILTNGSPVRQRNKIRALGLTRWIPEEHISVSLELGVHKPDPEVFVRYKELICRNGYPGSDSAGALSGSAKDIPVSAADIPVSAGDIPIKEKTSGEQETALSDGQMVSEAYDWWYVGDLYEHDIEPAIKAGWHTIWMVHDNEDKTVQRELEPDHIVRSGKELKEMLLKI